jgi:hypothetical protein
VQWGLHLLLQVRSQEVWQAPVQEAFELELQSKPKG